MGVAVLPLTLAMALMTAVVPATGTIRSEHECLASYAVSQQWRSVTVFDQRPGASDRGVLVSLLTALLRRKMFVQLSAEPAAPGSECPSDSDGHSDTDAAVLLRPAGGAQLCPRGALHAWTEVRRAGRGGVTFISVRWDAARGRMAPVDSVDCFGGRLTAQPVARSTGDFRGVLRGVHVAVSIVGRANGQPMDGRGGGISNLRGMAFSEHGEGVLLRYMSETLGFSYSIRLVSHVPNGNSFNEQENMLANNSVDMTVNSLTQTVRRSSMMRFSFPTSTFQDRVAIQRPRVARRPFEPKRPFSRAAWIAVVLCVTLLALWMAGCQALAVFSTADGRRSAFRRELSFLAGWWTLAAMVCKQYGRGLPVPTRVSHAVFCFLCFGFTFLVGSYYISVIHSFMALDRPQLPYSTIRQGLETGSLSVGYNKGGVMERKILTARDPLLQLIAKHEHARPSGVDFWSQESDQLGAWLRAGPHHGFLLAEEDLETHQALHPDSSCNICFLPELVSTRPSGVAYSHQFRHSRLLDLQLLRLRELGLLQRVAGRRREPAALCQLRAEPARWQPLGLEDLSAVLALVPLGIAAALVVLAAERAVHLISIVAVERTVTHIP
ncbi:glutamate receptor U1-like [Amphibalanus amphitrite]|uniref:glutamate receptor U1-like n=1 Tax=Amphibalanus amphitrite TaxID=1232801 RepID=UPI001C91BD48|nr:glutamate receptor U1-like [Amphibalanus amphitrite]